MSVNNQKPQLKRISLAEKMKNFKLLKKQRGMTLLEIIIVLGIIGTIAAGVVVLAQRAFDSRAISDVVTNTNTVRVAMKDAYQRADQYPASSGAAVDYTLETIKAADSKEAIARLVQLDKISTDEARNNISNDFYNVGGAQTVSGGKMKGFFIEVNGLDQGQCRNVLSQAANQWDYVEVAVAAVGAYSKKTTLDMSVAAVKAPAEGATAAIIRSLEASSNYTITPDLIAQVCANNSSNSIILGSR